MSQASPERHTVPPVPGRRDPEGRRRAIIEAAATLISADGLSALTHRAVAQRAGVSLGSTTKYFASLEELRIAAYQLLADEIDAELNLIEQQLPRLHSRPDLLVEILHRFLVDDRQVLAEIALFHAGTTDPTRRKLALRWTERFIDVLSGTISREAATAIAVYLDGATIHAGLHEAPLEKDQLTRVITALIEIDSADQPTTISTVTLS